MRRRDPFNEIREMGYELDGDWGCRGFVAPAEIMQIDRDVDSGPITVHEARKIVKERIEARLSREIEPQKAKRSRRTRRTKSAIRPAKRKASIKCEEVSPKISIEPIPIEPVEFSKLLFKLHEAHNLYRSKETRVNCEHLRSVLNEYMVAKGSHPDEIERADLVFRNEMALKWPATRTWSDIAEKGEW